MKHRDFQHFTVDVSRYRPVLTVLLAALAVMPSVWEAATGNLSFVAVLGRLALSLLFCGALVWVTTGVMLHYARVQVRARSRHETSLEIEP
ncbi:MAG TPA: hypothetical protein VMF35_11140 [Acidimicrobiales bacterium]|nr:hypothetical protein [Acidimicrobiales bacterium]